MNIDGIGNELNSYFQSGQYISDNSYYFLKSFNKDAKAYHIHEQRSVKELDVHSIRKDFPILQRKVNGKSLIWFDNAATTQKPKCVIDSITRYYSEYNSNVHRGAHTLAKLATDAYDSAREKVREFLGASSKEEIIFVRGATEAINLVAGSYGISNIHEGDEILMSMMEHHSNIVPWQSLAKSKGASLKIIPVSDRGEIMLEEYKALIGRNTRLIALTHVSNALGTVNPVHEMIKIAHDKEVPVLIDGAQSVPHMKVDVKSMDADFYVFSGHKAYGPTGIGVLYGKKELLEKMPPWQRGGGMIKNVDFDETSYNSLPFKFEAGTGNIADAVGLGAAIDYLQGIGMDVVERHERKLTREAMKELSRVPGLKLVGTAPDKISVLSFVLDGVTPEDAAHHLNKDGIAVRAGHHCAQPALKRYGLDSSIRASTGLYNTMDEVECLLKSLYRLQGKRV